MNGRSIFISRGSKFVTIWRNSIPKMYDNPTKSSIKRLRQYWKNILRLKNITK